MQTNEGVADDFSPNFVSGQVDTCELHTTEEGRYEWSYVRHGKRVVTAGMPSGPEPERALELFEEWCHGQGVSPLLFGCEAKDLRYLRHWQATEIGRQPLFQADATYHPDLRGPDQPLLHRKVRRQARRAWSKGVDLREVDVPELWRLSESGAFDAMLFERWKRRGLADFSFLVEFRIEKGQNSRRAFLVENKDSEEILGLVFLVPSERGWLFEHQLLATSAPNGTAELILCRLLSHFIKPGRWLSLGITPLFKEMVEPKRESKAPSILQWVPAAITSRLLTSWESLYGFRSLLTFREKLEPDAWEAVYWAVPRRHLFSDVMAVLKAFAGGSLLDFAYRTVRKRFHSFSIDIRESWLPKLNLFYVVSLILWIPILWNLDGVPLFGHAQACKVWAIYDVLLLFLFALHQKVPKAGRPSFITELLLGLVLADTALSWIQTWLYHGGFPTEQPLGMFVFMINTAPISALVFLGLVRFATKPVPFRRRDVRQT